MLHFAITTSPEVFDPDIHGRNDLDVFELIISQSETEYALAELRLRNPKASLDGTWLHISEYGKHLAHGEISVAPRGTVGSIYSLDVICRPEDAEAQKAALAESLKSAPGWDPLFSESEDISDVLAGNGSVLAWSRTENAVSVVDPLAGSQSLNIVPLEGTLDVQADEAAPQSATLILEVEWKQLNQRYHEIGPRIGRVETMTHTSLVSNWPAEGESLGGGYRIAKSRLTENESDREDLAGEYEIGLLKIDPAWESFGSDTRPAQKRVFEAELGLEHKFEVRRKETCTVSVSAGIQPLVRANEQEEETIRLRDIAKQSSASPWQPQADYLEGDQVVDGDRLLEARQDHFSGDRLNAADWRAIGETSYISSRRIGSFFKTARGQDAIAHAIERLKSRLRYAARSVLVSCDCAMPDPDLLTHDAQATIESPDLIGGNATGRVVGYAMHWSNGRRFASVTIACAAGTGEISELTVGEPAGATPTAYDRVGVRIRNAYDVQKPAYDAGQDVPETVIEVEPIKSPATDFEQSVFVPISGFVPIPKQVILI